MKHKDIEFDIKVNVTDIETNENGGFKFKTSYSVDGEQVGEDICSVDENDFIDEEPEKTAFDHMEDLVYGGALVEMVIGSMVHIKTESITEKIKKNK